MNSFGRVFRVTSWGESHGPAVGCVLDGCPSRLTLCERDIQEELDRRRPGQSDMTTSRGEEDIVEILSGVFKGMTLGTPISMLVRNKDADSSKYTEFERKPRPGHADFTWRGKFGNFDFRGGGRASARETVGRVAAGAVAKKLINGFGVHTIAYAKQVGTIRSDEILSAHMKGVVDLIDSNNVRALDVEKAKDMEEEVKKARKRGDSIGGVVECVTFNLPVGLGEPVFGKITAELAGALASIPAVKGVEFGLGFEACKMFGSQTNDEFAFDGKNVRTLTNNAGGVLGGITDGMPLVLRVGFKPTASIKKRQRSVDLLSGKNSYVQIDGRHDPCIIPRAVPVVEAMVNLVIADQMMLSQHIPRKLR